MKFLVIGGGVCGLFLSYYLLKSGHDVSVVDAKKGKVRTSAYNAGQLSLRPSFTDVTKESYWLSKERRLERPWLELARGQSRRSYDRTATLLAERSLALYREFFSREKAKVDLVDKILELHSSLPEGRGAHSGGRFMSPKELAEVGYKGFEGGWLIDEWSLYSVKLLQHLQRRVEELGGRIVRGSAALNKRGSKIAYASVGGRKEEADIYVVAAGSWSREVCRPLGFDPMVIPARGLVLFYGTGGHRVIDYPAHYEEEAVAAAQHDRETLRFTSYFELAGFDPRFSKAKVERLRRAVTSHFSRARSLKLEEMGVGYRPSTPDQLPVVGKIPRCANGYVLTGATRKGMALAPLLGKILIAKMTEEQEDEMMPALDPGRFERKSPSRF